MKRIISILLVVTTTLSLALTGCSGNKNSTASTSDNNASSEPTEGGSITVGISQDLDSLDPHLAVSAGTKEVLFNIFEGLVKPDADGNLQPAVASDYDDFRRCEDLYIYTCATA